MGTLRLTREETFESVLLELQTPLCDWKGSPVSTVELVGEEGSEIAHELRPFEGKRVRLGTNSLGEPVSDAASAPVTATYTSGSVRSLEAARGGDALLDGESTDAEGGAPTSLQTEREDVIELVVYQTAAPRHEAFGCVGKDVLVVLPEYPGMDGWKVTDVDAAFGKPKLETRERFYSPTGHGREFRWTTRHMDGGTYFIQFASGLNRVKVKLVLSCDD